MTERQFERVFSIAQDLQTEPLEPAQVKKAENALLGFEGGKKRKATTVQSAYVLNMLCMDMSGTYNPRVLGAVRELYLDNVTIVGE